MKTEKEIAQAIHDQFLKDYIHLDIEIDLLRSEKDEEEIKLKTDKLSRLGKRIKLLEEKYALLS